MDTKPNKTTEWDPVDPHASPMVCRNCGEQMVAHRQDILNDPTRFACPVSGIDWGWITGENRTKESR